MVTIQKLKTYTTKLSTGISSASIYWGIIICLCFIKMILVSDQTPKIVNQPHDAYLYVKRAYMLLMDGSFGPYDSKVLVKLPGISYLLAFFRFLGIPSLLAHNALLIMSGLYVITGMRLNGVSRWVALLSFSLMIFHPFTESIWWIRILREPINMICHYFLFGALLMIYHNIVNEKYCLHHTLLFGGIFSFAILTREENILLFAFLGMAFVSSLLLGWRMNKLKTPPVCVQLVMLLLIPIIAWYAGDSLARRHIQRHYGLPLLHEFSEGEYPAFIAAIRSVGNDLNDKRISISQEQLQKISKAVPMLKPLVDAMPKPGPGSWSDKFHGVKDEFINGFINFWIHDSACKAGLFHTLLEAQNFYRNGRLAIEKACSEGKLECVPDGSSLFPRFKLSWIKVMIGEIPHAIKCTFSPPVGPVNYSGPGYDRRFGNEVGLIYQAVTMSSHYRKIISGNNKEDLSNDLLYWLNYPDVARSSFGPNHTFSQGTGALAHYQKHGKKEGRVWHNSYNDGMLRFDYFSVLDGARTRKTNVYLRIYPYLVGLAVLSMLVFAFLFKQSLRRPVALLGLVTGMYTLIISSAVLYLSVPLGRLDPRVYAAMSAMMCVLSPAMVNEAWEMIKMKLKKRNRCSSAYMIKALPQPDSLS